MPCEIKGQSFNGLLVGLETLRGSEARLVLLPMLNEELRLLIDRRAVMSSDWYPLRWYSELTRAIAHCYVDVDSLELGRLGMRHDINQFSRFVLSVASPLLLLKLTRPLMGMYFKGAVLKAWASGEKEGRLQLSGLDGACDATWKAIVGAVAAFVELSGGKRVVSRITDGGGDSETCEITVSWA